MKTRWIFLDVDGVLNNRNYFSYCFFEYKQYTPFIMDERNVSALNLLLNSLRSDGEVKIVISSTWRMWMDRLEETMKQHSGIFTLYIGRLMVTEHNDKRRGEQITKFMEDNRIQMDDVIVIDDDVEDIVDYVPEERIIKTVFDTGLTFMGVTDFLKRIGVKKKY